MANDSPRGSSAASGDLSRPMVAVPPGIAAKTPAPAPVVVKVTEEAPARAAAVQAGPALAAAPSIESLDSELATMTEKMLASEEPGALPVPASGPAAPGEKPQANAPVQPPTRAETNAAPAAPHAPSRPAPSTDARAPRTSILPALRVRAEQAALATLARASAPALKRSSSFRRSLGWVALNTFFLAACLWMYVLFLRSPHPAEAGNAPFDFATSGLPVAAVHEPEETNASNQHGAPAGHSAEQAGKSAQESGHGGAKGLKTAPKPLLDGAQRFIVNDSMPSFKQDAKPKKDASSGGH